MGWAIVSRPVAMETIERPWQRPGDQRPGGRTVGSGDDILAALGLDWDTVIDLKVRGVVA